EPHDQIRAMRTGLRMPEHDVPVQVLAEGFRQRTAPAAPELHLQPPAEQTLRRFRRGLRQALHIGRPHGGNGLAGFGERPGPRLEPRSGHSRLESGVSLPKDPPIPLPRVQVAMFHVEHTPVDETPALARPALDQAMNARIDDVDAEDPRDLRDRPPFQPIDPIGEPLWTYLDANPPRVRPLAIIDDHREARPPVLDQPSRLPRPKRAAAADEKTSLQQARLRSAE